MQLSSDYIKNTESTDEKTPEPEAAKPVSETDLKDRPVADEKNDNIVRLSFAGDVMFENGVANTIKAKGLSYLFDEVKPVFEASDLTMVNLETSISTRGVKDDQKQYSFRADPDLVRGFKEASGINVVSLANNHILDYGRDALSDTIKFLEEEGIDKAGAGENLDEASKPLYYNIKGNKIAIIAASRVIPYVSWYARENESGVMGTYSTKLIKSVIEEADKNADVVIVYVHWGQEKSDMPDKVQKELARTYIDSGADLVIGAHPHVLQGLELYKDRLIAYSLGNFVFTDSKRDTMILSVTVENRKITGYTIIPCQIRSFKPHIIRDENLMNSFFEQMQILSEKASKDEPEELEPTE